MEFSTLSVDGNPPGSQAIIFCPELDAVCTTPSPEDIAHELFAIFGFRQVNGHLLDLDDQRLWVTSPSKAYYAPLDSVLADGLPIVAAMSSTSIITDAELNLGQATFVICSPRDLTRVLE